MRRLVGVAWAIARRDYVAAVRSRLFVLFLILPLLAAGFGGLIGGIGARGDAPSRGPSVRVTIDRLSALDAARDRLAARLGDDAMPVLVRDGGDPVATLGGTLDRPRLVLRPGAPSDLAGRIALIIDEARSPHVPPPGPGGLIVSRGAPDRAAQAAGHGHAQADLARAAQYAIFLLTIMLAGRLLANFIEERGNKVIEVLAAAAPVDAIFYGKLLGMLLFSLTCVAAWGGAALLLLAIAAPGDLAALAVPAVGWWLFAPLALLYFATDYLLFGTILLGLGAHARSPADVQTLALPTTIAQLLLFGLASLDVARPDHWVALAAAALPWSSPLAMAARAAERPALWPHLLALAWQGLWLWASVRFAARRFRRAILGSA